jgi:hypothetical protein
MIWKNLKRWLGIALVGAGMVLAPQQAYARRDYIWIDNGIVKNGGDGRTDELKILHSPTAQEGYSGSPSDIDYVYPSPWAGEWAPKITTTVDNHELEKDARPTNSTSKFEATLAVVVQNNQNVQGTTRLGINVLDDGLNLFFDPKRHYLSEYRVFSNFLENASSDFLEKKNLRDLCTNANVTYFWNCPSNLNVNVNGTNGTFNFGKFTQWCDWNQLLSSSTGAGSNSWQGVQIVDYNTNLNVELNANTSLGGFVDKFIVTRTDNIGDVSVVTNDIVGENLVFTNVPVNGIKGSNQVHAIYGRKNYPLSILTSGEGSGLSNPTGIVNVSHGDYTNVAFTAGIGSSFDYYVLNGLTNDVPNTNSYNVAVGPVTNSQTLEGIFDINKYLITATSGVNGSVFPTNALVPYNSSTSVVINANNDYKIDEARKNGEIIGEASGLESYVVDFNNITNSQTLDASFKAKTTTNGIAHPWLTKFGITNKNDSVENENPDNDYYNNLAEYKSDTDPTNGLSYFASPIIRRNSQNNELEVVLNGDNYTDTTSTSRTYRVLSTSDLNSGNWDTNYTCTGTGSNINYAVTNASSSGKGFYRGSVGLD